MSGEFHREGGVFKILSQRGGAYQKGGVMERGLHKALT